MGPLIVLVGSFLVAWAVITVLMWTVCFIKATYSEGEHWFWKHVIAILDRFHCENCKKACEDHWRLIGRSALFAFVAALGFTLAKCVV